jgi:hypothetical protein
MECRALSFAPTYTLGTEFSLWLYRYAGCSYSVQEAKQSH